MPPRKQSKQKRIRRRRAPMRRRMDRAGDIAKVHHTYAFDYPLTTGVCYAAYNFALSNSNRAISVAKAYQYYRIAQVEVKFKPTSDTFVADAVASTGRSVPYLYYMVDKAGTFNNNGTSVTALKIAGAKAHRLDDKTVRVAFKPAVLVGSTDNAPGASALTAELSAMTRVSPWITTNANAGELTSPWAPNSVDHQGLSFGIESLQNGSAYVAGTVQFRITYEFKKPFWPGTIVPTVPPTVIDLDTIGDEGND